MKAASSALETPSGARDDSARQAELLAALPKRSAIGAFVLIGAVAFLVMLFNLTDVGTFRGRYYATTVIENAGGMRNGDPVQMRGVNIGRVSNFTMLPDGVGVTLEIYNRYFVPDDSRVAVRSAGLLGGMVVDVQPGSSTERASRDNVLPGSVEPNMMSAATELVTPAEDVLARAALLLSEENIGSLGASASDLQIVLAELSTLAATQRQQLALLSESLRRSAEGVERATAGPELERAVAHVDSLTARLDETTIKLSAAGTSLQTVLGRLERGEGTLGRLSTDATLYDNLNAAVVSLQQLVADIRREPRRYLNIEVF
jgi:phospholipid/cholesterol/gamma-HCH transport system substrate-binding protein